MHFSTQILQMDIFFTILLKKIRLLADMKANKFQSLHITKSADDNLRGKALVFHHIVCDLKLLLLNYYREFGNRPTNNMLYLYIFFFSWHQHSLFIFLPMFLFSFKMIKRKKRIKNKAFPYFETTFQSARKTIYNKIYLADAGINRFFAVKLNEKKWV